MVCVCVWKRRRIIIIYHNCVMPTPLSARDGSPRESAYGRRTYLYCYDDVKINRSLSGHAFLASLAGTRQVYYIRSRGNSAPISRKTLRTCSPPTPPLQYGEKKKCPSKNTCPRRKSSGQGVYGVSAVSFVFRTERERRRRDEWKYIITVI